MEIKIHNLADDSVVIREMNEQEVAQIKSVEQNNKDIFERKENLINSKKAIFEKLGLTEEEAKLLLS